MIEPRTETYVLVHSIKQFATGNALLSRLSAVVDHVFDQFVQGLRDVLVRLDAYKFHPTVFRAESYEAS